MAAAASLSNDDIVDKLIHEGFIKSPMIERCFRAIDRSEYLLSKVPQFVNRDLAWKSANLHLINPRLYAEVLDLLALTPGLSFLNLESGTGYLNMLAGLILGVFGTNIGIEINDTVWKFAKRRSELFKNSAHMDEFDFCAPRFIKGNCMNLDVSFSGFDRVYCGGRCPKIIETYMKHLIKVGGTLVVVIDEVLTKTIRTSQTTWESQQLHFVHYPMRIFLNPDIVEQEIIHQPITLMQMCRSVIRKVLCDEIVAENPHINQRTLLTAVVEPTDVFANTPVHYATNVENIDDFIDEDTIISNLSGMMDQHPNWDPYTIPGRNASNDSDTDMEVDDYSDTDSDTDAEPSVDLDSSTDPDTGSDDDSPMGSDDSPLVRYRFRARAILAVQNEIWPESSDSDGESTYVSPFTALLHDKIQALRLPENVKEYLHYTN